ncbi:MAG: hypothetical protein ACE5NA_00100 [Nitrospiraceae bacterium]
MTAQGIQGNLDRARERALDASRMLNQFQNKARQRRWASCIDRAERAVAALSEARAHAQLLSTLAILERDRDTDLSPMLEPDEPKRYRFNTSDALPWSPRVRTDHLSIPLTAAPAGTVHSVELHVLMEGEPLNQALINRIISFGNSKRSGAYEHRRNFVYCTWKDGRAKLRSGWNVEHQLKTTDVNKLAFAERPEETLLEFFQIYRYGAHSMVAGGRSKTCSKFVGDLPPAVGKHGVTLKLGGHGDTDNEINENETSPVGLTYKRVWGSILYAADQAHSD